MGELAKKRMTGRQRRAQVVAVATKLFVKKGFKGTTTREIAAKAGISEAVIYKHFARTADLYAAIIESLCDNDSGEDRLVAAIKGKQGREVFYEAALFLITEQRRDPTLMRLLLLSALENQKLSELMIKTRILVLIDLLEGHIKEQIRLGAMREVDPAAAARAFLGMVLHYGMGQEVYGLKRFTDFSDEFVARTFVDIFFDGVTRR